MFGQTFLSEEFWVLGKSNWKPADFFSHSFWVPLSTQLKTILMPIVPITVNKTFQTWTEWIWIKLTASIFEFGCWQVTKHSTPVKDFPRQAKHLTDWWTIEQSLWLSTWKLAPWKTLKSVTSSSQAPCKCYWLMDHCTIHKWIEVSKSSFGNRFGPRSHKFHTTSTRLALTETGPWWICIWERSRPDKAS